jgi:thymidylate synthase
LITVQTQFQAISKSITVHITHPGVRPLSPDIPLFYGIPNPTSDVYIEQDYLSYLIEDTKKPNEDYTYGTYIKPQMKKIIERYKRIKSETGGYRSNQEHIIVGNYMDHLDMLDPPCLRSIDTRIQDNKLIFFIYFRSWDLWGGFPANLGGLQLMKEHMANEIGVEDGEMVVSSKGLHLYRYVWELAQLRTNKQRSDLQKDNKLFEQGKS